MSLLAACAVASAGLVIAPVAAAWPPRQPDGNIERQTSEILAKAVHDPQAPATIRTEAAALLVQRSLASNEDRDRVEQILRGPATELSPAWYVLGGLARQSSLPEWVFAAVTALPPNADERTLCRALGVLASVRTRESAKFLLDQAGSTASESVRRASLSALGRLSGRSDLNDNLSAWRDWLEHAQALSHNEWSELLVAGLARRADSADGSRQATVGRLVEAYRRVHVSLPADQRGEFLGGLLRDDTDEVRALGFELVSRELSENVRLGSSVDLAAISLLQSPIASVRERAGLLIAQLSPPAAREPVRLALGRESDAGAASALLRAASRWPDEGLLEIALKWLATPGAAMASSVDYIRSLVRAGFVQDPEARALVLDRIRAIPADKLPPGACDVLVHIGGQEDMTAVARQLSSTSQAVRLAAAQSLLVAADHVDDILLAAQNDPELFDIAVRAVSMYWPTSQGFRSIASLRAPSQEAWRRGLLRLAEMMPAPDILEVSGTAEVNLREPLLANFTSPNRILSERHSTSTFEALGDGLVELSRLRIDLGKPDAALAALDSLPELGVLEGEQVVNALRAEALLCLGRIDDAAAIPAEPAAWISALTRSIDKPFARELAERTRSRFAEHLSKEQASRLAVLQRRLAGVGPESGDEDRR